MNCKAFFQIIKFEDDYLVLTEWFALILKLILKLHIYICN